MKNIFAILFPFLLLYGTAYGQVEESNKFEKETLIKAKKSSENTPKLPLQETEEKREKPEETPQKTKNMESDAGAEAPFELFKETSIVSESPIRESFGELQLIKVSEELKIDCVWVKAAEYYEIWDSKYVNPYGKDAKLFKDTIHLVLYNLLKGELWSAPLETTLQTSNFGYRWGRFHHGIDLNLEVGTPVQSVFDGIIRISEFGRGYGNYVVVRHKNGLETLYAHLSERKVEVGQEVKAGQIIGLGGSTGWSTGPHLHFEVRYEGNTFNPLSIYDFSKAEQLITQEFELMPHHFRHHGNKVRKTISHRVLEGETLSIISAKYNIPVSTLAKVNQLPLDASLQSGQVLTILK